MRWPRKLSLRSKITFVIMITTFTALCAAGTAFAEYWLYRFKQSRVEDLNALANILGTNSAAPLEFKDPQSARDILQALGSKQHMLSGVIYDRDGAPFAIYRSDGSQARYTPPSVKNQTSRFLSDRVLIFQQIVFQGEKIGYVFLEADTVKYRELLNGYLIFFGLIVAVVSLGAFAMAARLQRPISNPILNLAWTTKMITGTRDYSIRAAKKSDDEVGVLIDGFNEMLEQIQKRDTDLRHAGEDLERRVDERTIELEQEIQDKQRAQEALSESEERIRLLLDSTAEAIYGIDREGKCTFCNPATLRLLGYEKTEDLLGEDMHSAIHHAHADGTLYPRLECTIYTALFEGDGMHSDEEVFWRGDGTSFPVEFWAYPIRKDGKNVGAVVTFLDITVRKRTEAALLEAKEAAESASRAKSEFLANMSHEIRTPMNGIIGMTDLALDTTLTPEQRDYLDLVKSSAESLLHVINDILDFSKIEAGRLELEQIEFKIRDVLGDTLKTLALRADKKHLELAVRVSPAVPHFLSGDPTRLRQLIVNLVGNSIKFTDRGNIIVDVELKEISHDGIRLHFCVSDTGVGIPVEKQRVIFESFAQADGSTTRRFGGTGLGLTISRQLVELMGGSIWVESETGKGSTFHFTASFKPGSQSLLQSAPAALSGLNILVVDDNSSTGAILAEMLTNWHMNAVLAESGTQALELMETAQRSGRRFALALLDARMQGIDGFSLAASILENPSLADAVILMLSADRYMADAARSRELGVQVFVTKPIGQSELLNAIMLVLGLRQVEEHLIEPAATPERPTGSSLHVLLAEDNLVNQKLAVRLLERGGHRVVVVANGKEALTAWENAGASEFELILMDIQMPEMDGMEATIAIREREKSTGAHIPIIAMTAHAMRGDKERCLKSGMDGYISKPVNPAAFVLEIERCVNEAKMRETKKSNSREANELFDRASLLERVEGDHELLTEMINLFVEDAPLLLAVMRDALLKGDMVVLERSAHSMKGAASNLSARITVAAAVQLERDAKSKDPESSRINLAKLEKAVTQLLPALTDLCHGVST